MVAIDFVAFEDERDACVLVLVEPGPWIDHAVEGRLTALQDRIYGCLEAVQIDSAVADSVRMKLWRLRPEELKGVAWTVQPAGCPPPPTDTSPMLSIGFIKEGPKPGVDDDRIGVFTLPYPATCSTRQGKTARDLVGEALRLLPGSGLRSQYLYHRPLP